MHVRQVWCELVGHNSFVSFQSEDQIAPFYDSQEDNNNKFLRHYIEDSL